MNYETDSLSNHMFSALVANKPGVMAKITGLITRRGFNIESISSGDAKEKGMIRLTIVIRCDKRSFEQLQKQIYKVIDTKKVTPIIPACKLEREMALIKIRSNRSNLTQLHQLIGLSGAKVMDSSRCGFIVEMVGSSDEVNRFIGLVPQNDIVEIARTGVTAINRWDPKDVNEQHFKLSSINLP